MEPGETSHLFASAAVALRDAGWDVSLFGLHEDALPCLRQATGVDLSGCAVRPARPAFQRPIHAVSLLAPRAARGLWGRLSLAFARSQDLLICATCGVPPACPAAAGVLYVESAGPVEAGVQTDAGGEPLRMADKEKLARLRTWSVVACGSAFMQDCIRARWRCHAEVLPPPVDTAILRPLPKEPLIAAGGFPISAELIGRAYAALCREGLQGWRLAVLLPPGAEHQQASVHQALWDAAPDMRTEVVLGADMRARADLLGRATFYWHARGARDVAHQNPDAFDSSPLPVAEAMACAAVPLVYAGGGAAEAVHDGRNGCVWRHLAELRICTRTLIHNPDLLDRYRSAALRRSGDFASGGFKQRFRAILMACAGSAC